MAFVVSAVTQVVKSWPGLDKLPTSVVVIVLSLVLCPVTVVALMAWMDREITWYMVFACMIGAFIVALVAMDGWGAAQRNLGPDRLPEKAHGQVLGGGDPVSPGRRG